MKIVNMEGWQHVWRHSNYRNSAISWAIINVTMVQALMYIDPHGFKETLMIQSHKYIRTYKKFYTPQFLL